MAAGLRSIGLMVAASLALAGTAALGAEPIATGYTNWDDITVEVMSVERKGSVLTVKWAVRNEGEAKQAVAFGLLGGNARTYVVDEESGTKYFVLTDEDNGCLASECEYVGSGATGIRDEVQAGKIKRYWMKLPAPPPEVATLTIFFDETEPLEEVPITDK